MRRYRILHVRKVFARIPNASRIYLLAQTDDTQRSCELTDLLRRADFPPPEEPSDLNAQLLRDSDPFPP